MLLVLSDIEYSEHFFLYLVQQSFKLLVQLIEYYKILVIDNFCQVQPLQSLADGRPIVGLIQPLQIRVGLFVLFKLTYALLYNQYRRHQRLSLLELFVGRLQSLTQFCVIGSILSCSLPMWLI